MSNYKLDLPQALVNHKIYLVFHVSLLRPFHESDNASFPDQTQPELYDFGLNNKHKWFINKIIGHCHLNNGQLEFEVHWSLGNTTWEPTANCAHLTALNQYLELYSGQNICFLRQCSYPSKKR
ncbi:hypothetical protein AN958_08403 [Leucoagaricus sp. SymC.cos]|nr:hypothetical protein AN958_08403 [Leucoagaricus sp. SymC.cos]